MKKSTILEGQTAILSDPGYVYKPKTVLAYFFTILNIYFHFSYAKKYLAYRRFLDRLKWRFDRLEL